MKKRLPWLVVLMFLGMVVSSVVGIFESVVSQLTILMMFQSVILGMSGNAGTQSLAVTVRVLMDENLEVKQKIGLVAKEVRVGFGDGLLLGILSFIVLGIFIMIVKGRPAGFAFAVSGCIGLALMCSMVISSLTGTLVLCFQQDWNRSGSGIRTSYYNDQRPYSSYRLLWTELAVFT